MKKKAIIFLFFLLTLSMSRLRAQQKAAAVNWITFEQLSDSLAIHPKKVLLFFHTDWCAYCRKMQREVFTDPKIVTQLNTHYYAVRFDAESTDTVSFDGALYTNSAPQKKTGSYHKLAELLAARQGTFSFPTTIILNAHFQVQTRSFEYLDRKKLARVIEF
ncbi:thioredoxin family protein [Sphingobacterium psychroaquaticum]|uniref:Thioredoxin-related protein n=1 Tax=Sphingobacterium psychroaquaticum TaxID=561061 RepID=A0A1X7K158_9SPHI|nr:thioredoxin fold domain-containing protein [Sphingobacterium psychroaquaticum]SMG34641.1 Thioredoxin-related protein [Sphingobacterium psychroaquaticum]